MSESTSSAWLRVSTIHLERPSTKTLLPPRLDDVVLEAAVRGGTDTLVSHDEDVTRAPDLLAALAAYVIEIMTVRQFSGCLTHRTAGLSTARHYSPGKHSAAQV